MHISERLPRESGRDYALRNLKENIVHLDLKPGSQISENELAAEMGLSRTPVREALIELSKVKIVEIHPQKKSVVSKIDEEMVDEAQFMRNVLECAVVRLDCEMARPEDVMRLRENVRLQNFYLENYYPDTLMDLDNQFHKLLFEIAKKTQVYWLTQNISIHFDRVRGMALSSVKNGKIVQDHEDLVDAIAQNDPDRAQRLMEQHLERYHIDSTHLREQYPEYFIS
jgi:DNA-binding GntR family transcriptional regulator